MFFDEGRFGLQPVLGRYWAMKGTPVQTTVVTEYTNFYLYSSVAPRTGESFSLMLPWVNTQMMNLYLAYLADYYADKEVMLIMDQAGWHRAKNLEVPDNIHIEFLPPYSPELNPVEKLWWWLRRHVCRNRIFENEEHLINELIDGLLQLSKAMLRSLCRRSYL